MLVDFEKIEWSWIISPKRFNAYLCRGQCSTNAHHPVLTDTGHTKILKVSHRMGSENKHYFENVGTCCHPIHYDYVQLIYINREGSVAVAKVNGMMATRCGCT
uniref:TGF_BETA_2 domain-containing protein n=1 Tax=Caenorhabditis japonica TaxID=281687 RepID=A0A8R1IQ16_CAEJA